MTSICKIITEPNINLTIRLHNGYGEKNLTTNQAFELLPEWQQVEVYYNGTHRLEIKDVTIDGQSIGENIYLAWFKDQNGVDYQPMNNLGNQIGTWSIILHSNISIFKERICSQLPNGAYGKNLFEHYQWFVDLGYNLKNSYSPQVDNFFARPQGLNLYRKQDYHLYPYIPLTLKLTDEQSIDIESELRALTYNIVNPKGAKVNPGWINSYIMLGNDPEKKCQSTDLITLPALKKWVTSTGITEFNHAVGLILPPGRAIEMHRDYMLHDKDLGIEDLNTTHNIYSLHINISQNSQSMIKVSGGGIMPDGVNILNNASYVHAGVNEGTTDRYVITIKNPRPFDFIKNWIVNSNIYFS